MCSRQVRQLRASWNDFNNANAVVVVVVPHEVMRVASWQKQGDKNMYVVADPGFLVSSLYGVAFQMIIHTDTSNTPGTFIIGKDGKLKWEYIGKGKRSYSDRPKIPTIIKKINETGANK